VLQTKSLGRPRAGGSGGPLSLAEGAKTMTRNATRRFSVTVMLAVLAAAVWAGGAAAVPPERTVFFELTYPITSFACPDAHLVEHDVGRITFTAFFNPDGTPRARP
jgi:hypothetical protein